MLRSFAHKHLTALLSSVQPFSVASPAAPQLVRAAAPAGGLSACKPHSTRRQSSAQFAFHICDGVTDGGEPESWDHRSNSRKASAQADYGVSDETTLGFFKGIVRVLEGDPRRPGCSSPENPEGS